MKTPFVQPYWKNKSCIHKNRLASHAYLVPYHSSDAAISFVRENSFFI